MQNNAQGSIIINPFLEELLTNKKILPLWKEMEGGKFNEVDCAVNEEQAWIITSQGQAVPLFYAFSDNCFKEIQTKTDWVY